jgi:hypothetical protein
MNFVRAADDPLEAAIRDFHGSAVSRQVDWAVLRHAGRLATRIAVGDHGLLRTFR